jgi:hypothetical protein
MKQLSAKRGAYRNEAAIRGMRSEGGSNAHLYHLAQFLPCHSKAPPPVGEYDEWLVANAPSRQGHSPITGAKLRRAVILRRNGENMLETARLIGMKNGQSLARWLAKLPPELSV